MAGEGLVALGLERLLPGAEEGVVDAEGAGRLGDGVALLGDELDRLGLELGGVGAPPSRQDGPPKSESTLLTGCPPFVGRSRLGRLNFAGRDFPHACTDDLAGYGVHDPPALAGPCDAALVDGLLQRIMRGMAPGFSVCVKQE